MEVEQLNIHINPENQAKWSIIDINQKMAYIKYLEGILNLMIARDERIEETDIFLALRLNELIDEIESKLDNIVVKISDIPPEKTKTNKTNYEKYMKYKNLFEESVNRNKKLKALIKELGEIICRNISCIKTATEKEQIDVEKICNGQDLF